MPIKAITTALDKVSTEQLQPLGLQFEREHPTYGHQVWIYVYNDEASASLVQGTVCMRDTTSPDSPGDVVLAAVSVSPVRIVGVAQHTIAAGSYGFIQRSGGGAEVLAGDGTVSADTGLIVDATDPGQATDVAATTGATFGYAHEAGVADALVTATIDCRG